MSEKKNRPAFVIGEVIPVRFTNCNLEDARGEITAVTAREVYYVYLDGIFAGLRGMLRVSPLKG